jgi:hypothetical protein
LNQDELATMDLQESKDGMMRAMEAVPTQAYWGLALGSVLLSAVLWVTGRRNGALFVGQWPPTFLALALLYKLLRPSREAGAAGMGQAAREMADAMR